VRADRAGTTFASLRRSRNFRLYFGGQTVSMAGTWMQTIAQGWLVLQLSGSGALLGLVTACQFLPVLFFGPFGGVIVDRVDTRRLLVLTQALSGALALALGILTVTGAVQLWIVFAMAIALGFVTVVDNPARQTFVLELVGPDLVSNAITLNSVNINAARVIGPAIAALMIAAIGVGPCFIVNAASYLAVIGALLVMDHREFHPKVLAVRAKGQVREGFRYVWHTPSLRTPLLMMFLIGTLAYEFQVVLPLLAKDTFDGGAGMYGVMSAAMGAGAVLGGLAVAGKDRHGIDALVRVSLFFGATIALLALSPTLAIAIVALVVVGMASITFLARANTTLQLAADPVMRGRVMALWTVAFLGSTPVGGPIIGVIAEYIGPRWALVTAALSCFGAAALGASQAWTSITRRAAARTATTA
jgi:MFS family permease